MKYKYHTITKKIKKYWLIVCIDDSEINFLLFAYGKIGIKCRYTRLKGVSDIVCFYIGKEPKQFIKDTEYALGSGQPN